MADPGFPVVGGAPSHWGGANLRRGCFSAKKCENKRIGSHWRGHALVVPPGSTNGKHTTRQKMLTASFALAKDAKGNLQSTIYVYEKD